MVHLVQAKITSKTKYIKSAKMTKKQILKTTNDREHHGSDKSVCLYGISSQVRVLSSSSIIIRSI